MKQAKRVPPGVDLVIVGVFAVAAACPVLAHHSVTSEFDANKVVTLKGTVTKLEWTNPHIWVYFDVKDDQGNLQRWQCEGGAPNTLTRNGWTKDALKIGDEITIEGGPARDGSKSCNVRGVVLQNGRRIFAGAAGGDTAR